MGVAVPGLADVADPVIAGEYLTVEAVGGRARRRLDGQLRRRKEPWIAKVYPRRARLGGQHRVEPGDA